MTKKKKKAKTGRKKAAKLSAQQKKFCQLWVIKQDLADAWLGAGYKCKSREVAKSNACRFMQTDANAQAYIAELLEKQQDRMEKTADDVIREIVKIGFANIQDYIEGDNVITDLSKIPRDQAAAIESVQTDIRHDGGDSEGYTEKVRFKCHPKLPALQELLDRWQGKPRQSVNISGAIGTRELSDEEITRLLSDTVIECQDAIAS